MLRTVRDRERVRRVRTRSRARALCLHTRFRGPVTSFVSSSLRVSLVGVFIHAFFASAVMVCSFVVLLLQTDQVTRHQSCPYRRRR